MIKIHPVRTHASEVGSIPTVRSAGFSARLRVTMLLCSVYALMYLDRINLSAAGNAIKGEFGLSNAQLGMAFSGFSWAYLATVMFGGWAARRYGPRIVLVSCAVLLGLATIGTAFAAGALSLFMVRLLVGAGEGPAFPAATQAMRNWYPPEKFGFIQGITHSASRLGAALAPPLVALLVLASGWRSSFVLCGVAVLAWSVAWWCYFRNDPREADVTPPSSAVDIGLPVVDSTIPILVWALTKRMLPVTLVMFAYGWVYWIFVSWLPLYFINHHHVDLRASAFLTSVPLMAGMIGNTAGGMLSDWLLRRTKNHRIARCSVVAGSLAGCAAALIPVALAHDLALALPCLALAMFFLELTIAPMYAIPMDMSKEFAGLGSSFIIIGVALAGITSPVIFGWIIDVTGNWNIPFATAVVVLLLGAGGVLLIRPDRPFVPPT